MKFRLALTAATMLATPLAFITAASAQPVTGPYVSGGAGYSIEGQQKAKDFIVNNVGQPNEARVDLRNGYTGEFSAGYGFGNGWRVELEGDYIHNGGDKVKANGTEYPLGGGEARYGAFVNALYDFDIGLPYLYPYVGAGVGWQEDAYQNFAADGAKVNKTRGSLAYQGIVGLSYPIAPVPGLSATLEYRFVALANSRKFGGSYNGQPL
ncbi:MAG: outer membrane beta-barrel protein, partial [Acidocella sp.]|nr:outer membrane beta-barrel protein [Acidocella sp.]